MRRMPKRAARTDPITVLIADDHRSFGEALEIALDREDDLRVIEVVTSGAEAIQSAAEHQPDILLVDVQMPDIDGIEATRRVHGQASQTAVIVLSGQSDEVNLGLAVQAGARGYLSKDEAIGGVAEAIRRAHRGEPLHTNEDVEGSLRRLRRRSVNDADIARRIERLTPREVEILQHMAQGEAPEEIARDLGMSHNTLRTHIQNVLTKLGVHSKLDAIIAAIRHGRVTTSEVVTLDEEAEQGP
jgi:DNA-binding NarL/FixJ family response regulator